MIFLRPEHEFLRQIARADFDPAQMGALITPSFDWQYLLDIALAHQLDGVLAWRLQNPAVLSDRLPVPAWVTAHAAGWAGYVNERMAEWPAEAQKLADALDAAGVIFAFAGCPVSYLCYGMDGFPRQTDDLDLIVFNDDYDSALAALTSTGWTVQPEGRPEGPWGKPPAEWQYAPSEKEPTPRLAAQGKFHADCELRAELHRDTSWAGLSEAGMFAGVAQRDVWGVTLPVIGPEATACYHAARAYAKAFTGRQPLGELSHIANAVFTTPTFDWTVALAILADCLLAVERGLLTLPQTDRNKMLRDAWATRYRAESTAAWIVWSWQLVDAIWPCIPPTTMADALALIGGECDPSVWVAQPDGSSIAARWSQAWDPEALIFGATPAVLKDPDAMLTSFLEPRAPAITVPAGADCWPRSEWEVMVLRAQLERPKRGVSNSWTRRT